LHNASVATALVLLDAGEIAGRDLVEELVNHVHLLRASVRKRAGEATGKEARDLTLGVNAAGEHASALLLVELAHVDREVVLQSRRPGDETLGDPPKLLGLRLGRLDALVKHQISREIAEHGTPVRAVTAELPARLPMSHDLSLSPGARPRA